MNRNSQERFALNPTNIDISRSRFLMTPEVKTSFNVGDLVPIGMPIEVLPGDTFEIGTAFAVRMQPLVSAPMDNLSFDYYFFFVPNRLVWDHWKEFMGENSTGYWIPQTEYTIPQIINEHPSGHFAEYSVADYMGLPTKNNHINEADGVNYGADKAISISALPFRGFALIYNEWFRNQNLIAPLDVATDDTNRNYLSATATNYNDPKISTQLGGVLPKVSKRPDYFTKALPGPQKGPDLTILDHMPVYFDYPYLANHPRDIDHNAHTIDGHLFSGNIASGGSFGHMIYGNSQSSFNSFPIGSTGDNLNVSSYINSGQPYDWYVDGNLSISALRIAFQVQKLYEKDARGGTRYREILKSHFGVTSPDASQQVPQYLGGHNVSININSVVQTSETNETPQGNIAGYSLTSHGTRGHDFIQSFTEHGYLFCVGCARVDQHTYQNGIHRSWMRKDRLSYYFPVLANISEQPIKNSEIYSNGTTFDDEVFGYQEAWAEYRYMPSLCTAEMRTDSTKSLDNWHFADYYEKPVSLSQSWIEEDKSNVDRTLAVTSQTANQLFGDFRFNIKATRPMPMYSIPGLVDHH